MAEPGWALCVLQIDDEVKLQNAYRQIYLDEYVRAEVRDWAGRRVRFHGPSFGHAFSEASNYRLSAGVHDVPLSLARLQRIRWIKLALTGEGVRIEVLAQTRQDSRGRMKRRRSLIVLDNRYVVVLEPSEDEGYEFVFITAFPADQSYLDRIRRGANVVERRGQK
ncbi:MAG: hypothetical protein Q7S97_12510 [Polaromonas sp.]|nr:hypothetical protein [Polaromonas sp.]